MAESTKDQKPSARKIQQARARGHVARSRELAPALAFLAVAGVAGSAGSDLWLGPFRELATNVGEAARTSFGPGDGWLLTLTAAKAWLPAAALLVGASLAATLVALFLQGGPAPADEALRIDPARLSPGGKIKSMFSANQLWAHVREFLGAVVAIGIAVSAVRDLIPQLPGLSFLPPHEVGTRLGSLLVAISWRMGLGLGLLAVIDVLMARLLYIRSLKMSRQELIREMRDQEGRPEVRARRRRRLLELLKSRSVAGVGRADVVVANPTHFAVALAYQREKMAAPQVVAKGRDRSAQRIRLEAIRAGVPVVENPQLARELYRKVEVGREVPPDLYLAVAEVIAFVMKLNAEMAARSQGAAAIPAPAEA